MSDPNPFKQHTTSSDLEKTTGALSGNVFTQTLALQLNELDLNTPHITEELNRALSAQGWSMGAFKALPKDAVFPVVRLVAGLTIGKASDRPAKIKAIIDALRPHVEG